jgi:hypothetical protein
MFPAALSQGWRRSTDSSDKSPSSAVLRDNVRAAAGAFAGADTVAAELGRALIQIHVM